MKDYILGCEKKTNRDEICKKKRSVIYLKKRVHDEHYLIGMV